MRRLILGGAFLLACLTLVAEPGSTITPLVKLEEAHRSRNPPRLTADEFKQLCGLIEAGAVATGDDFYRAAKIAQDPVGQFKRNRTAYELTLAAVASGMRDAEADVSWRWDALQASLSRPIRIQLEQYKSFGDSEELTEPAPSVLRQIWLEPENARSRAIDSSDNPEIEEIVNADQAIRRVPPSKQDIVHWAKMQTGDAQRLARIHELIKASALRTGRDFTRASLVLQHGQRFASFRLAHECAVTALLLGDRDVAPDLVAMTYDRMLLSIGHDQRFGTQGAMVLSGDPNRPADVDTRGINDAVRAALGRDSLEKETARYLAK